MKLYLRLLSYLAPYWKRLTLTIGAMFLFALFSGFSIGMISPFLRVIFEGQPIDVVPAVSAPVPSGVGHWLDGLQLRLGALIEGATAIESLRRISVAIIAIFFLKSLFGYLQNFLMVSIEQLVIRDIRNELYGHLHDLPLRFFHDFRTGQLISRMTSDITLVRGVLTDGFANLIRHGFLVLVYLGVMIWSSWRLTLLSALVIPPITLVIVKVGKRLRKGNRSIQEYLGDLASLLQETITGIRVVKAFAMEEFEKRKFREKNLDYYRTFVKTERIGSLGRPLTEFLGAIGAVVILWFGGREVLETGSLSADRFFVFLAASLSLLSPFKVISNFNHLIQQGLVACERVFGILDTRPDVAEPVEPIEAVGFEDRIELRGVGFAYTPDEPILREIDLTIRKGEIVALVGPSGAGKSTIADLIVRFFDPTEGEILLDGVDLRRLSTRSLRRLMGIVTQEVILFNDTIFNNIAYGLEEVPEARVVEAAKAANAHEFILAMPEGYRTVVGERGVKMSAGQRQRIAIARAVLKNPPILIFDEATSSLDTESELLVQTAVQRLMKDRTTLVIAHRLNTVHNADRIVVVDRGRIVESGTHFELIAKDGLYRRLYELQFQDSQLQKRG
jgi:subfamily B ATP-binding cassette protein MsbA